MCGKVVFNQKEFDLSVIRLCWQLIENHSNFSNTVLIGMQPRGYKLAEKIHSKLKDLTGILNINLGSLDITFFRDDLDAEMNLFLRTKLILIFW
jgi:pyrimidine operon attenuation protein/uracil phosphoribosyltransferase